MSNVYEIITNNIVEKIETMGELPWHKPWNSVEVLPLNTVSKKTYRGVNVLILYLESMNKGYSSPYWLTYKQAKDLGGHVNPGEKGTPVVFWKFIEVDAATEEDPNKKKKVPLLRYYTVFNVDQCELPEKVLAKIKTKKPEVNKIEEIEKIVANYNINIRHGGTRAAYNKNDDFIMMPDAADFDNIDSYYHALFHEMIHSTGHKDRLNRESIADASFFGDENYSKEELVAEIGACFLSSMTNIKSEIENSAAYVKGWLKKIKEDSKLIIHAAAAAQKAVDYILKETNNDSE